MPKISTINKEMILNAAFEIVRSEGFISLSARNIAKKIGCSTQPIYWVYDNMDVLKQEIIAKVMEYLKCEINSYRKTGNPFLDLGLGYVYVAHTESALFKAIYVDNVLNIKLTDIIPDKNLINAMKEDVCIAKINENKLDDMAVQAWVFVHGLASLIAVGMMVYDEEKIRKLLDSFFVERNEC